MSFKTENRLIRCHTATIIDYLNQGPSGILYHYSYLIRPGIDSVLYEFLNYGCRPLNDLSRSNHICYITW